MSISDSFVIINGTARVLSVTEVDLNFLLSFGHDDHVQLVFQSILDQFYC